MAVNEVGTPTTHDDTVGGTAYSAARTVTAGSKGLTIQISYYNASGAVTPPTMNWNTNEAFTLVASSSNAIGGNDRRCALYFLANPTAGSFNVTGTFSNTCVWRSRVREWSNCSSTHGGASANGDGTTATVNVASVVSGEVTIDAMISGANVTPTPGSGQNTTNLYAQQVGGSTYGGASTDPSSTGTVTMDWTCDSTWAIAAMALVEDVGGGGGPALWAQSLL